jgi:hypothetical protein
MEIQAPTLAVHYPLAFSLAIFFSVFTHLMIYPNNCQFIRINKSSLIKSFINLKN